ncbi:MAG: adenylate/guanylate cyclase domain-containing protein, partial [Cyanobacteriota bacterium]
SPQGITEAIPGGAWLQQELTDLSLPSLRPLAFAAIQGPLPKRPLGINYRGGSGQVRLLPAWQLEQAPRQLFRGRTVLIGATAPELGNLQETPFGALNGTEVQAAALASVLEGKGLWRLPEPLEMLLLALWTLSIGLVLGRTRQAIRSLALGAGLTAIACAAVVLPWWLTSLWLPATSLLSLPLFALVCRAGPQAWQEVRERAYLHQVLARRVSPALLQAILRQPDPFWNQLGGHRHRCVVLFSDLVGFTALSSRLPTAELFPLLNRYFASMAQPVIEEEGLLDKFIGDALMAEFGLPRSRGDQAEALAAVRAALGMQRNLEQLNRELADQGIEPLQHGIGLHVGEVIAGNLGSPQRLEFTAVGMAVNVACRLETLTRRWPQYPILITADLLALVADQVEVEALGAHPLKGLPAPVEVYALLGWRPDTGPGSTGPA